MRNFCSIGYHVWVRYDMCHYPICPYLKSVKVLDMRSIPDMMQRSIFHRNPPTSRTVPIGGTMGWVLRMVGRANIWARKQ